MHMFVSDLTRLDQLDDLLSGLRLAVQRPGYRRRLLAGLGAPGGVTGLRVLRAVQVLSTDGSPSIKDVAARLAVEHSTASRAVDSAVREGLLRKQPCADDQRRIRLELTPDSEDLLARTGARRTELLATITRGWEQADLDRLIELLEGLQNGYDRLEDLG